MSPREIRRLLIANRGEIAIRVARTAREMGIVPLGVYSDADARAYHLEFMETSARVGAAPASESYLNAARIIEVARALGADAIHPGYGFLSERAEFARAVHEAGLIFVGPPAEAIEALGDKAEAKRRVRDHKVPVIPGYDGADQSPAALAKEAAAIGTPLLIKARAGGGGRGMRIVTDLRAFGELLEAAQREALAAFGDATVLLERYLERPRHVEFQILADEGGTTIHLGERECSIQRRYQKIVEEAPSVALTPELRARMGAAAVRAAQSVGYVNAGTIEFLLDENGAFYFLEANARLQVEHPVTELVYGLDLVRLQLEIASGRPLRLKQNEIVPQGWAIEARINAEDPSNDYLPASGTIVRWKAPHGQGIRLDAGVRSGSEVSIYYDSLLAKLIAHGPDRATALARLREALASFAILGVTTNLGLLSRIARESNFAGGKTTTAYLPEHPELTKPAEAGDDDLLLASAALLGADRAWRPGGVGIPIALRYGGRIVRAVASRRSGPNAWRLDGDLAGDYEFELDGDCRVVAGDSTGRRWSGYAVATQRGVDVLRDGDARHVAFVPPPSLEASAAGPGGGRAGIITSPLPGKIVKVAVKPGDAVVERDLLVVLEAMKMEHRIEATQSGVVKSVAVSPGNLVSGGATLLEIG